MKRFKNILFFTDINEKSQFAFDCAVDLARRNEGRLTVAGVRQELPRDLQRLAAALPMESLEEVADRDLRERLEAFVAPFRTSGLSLEIEVLNVKPDGFVSPIKAD
jgi:nucleotide-binding universal stress UspA family protein